MTRHRDAKQNRRVAQRDIAVVSPDSARPPGCSLLGGDPAATAPAAGADLVNTVSLRPCSIPPAVTATAAKVEQGAMAELAATAATAVTAAAEGQAGRPAQAAQAAQAAPAAHPAPVANRSTGSTGSPRPAWSTGLSRAG